MVIGLSRQMEKKYLEIVYTFNDWSYVLKNEPKAENEEEGRIEESYSRILVFMIRMDKKMQNIE